MAQQTNLNVSPYFDDFDAESNYHKVLFKPGYPVQARELTGLQSIMQNQIDKFGQHFFKEGAKVIPGNTAYTQNYHALQVNNTHLGYPVDYYIEQLIDRKIVGLNSGVTAIISKVLKSSESEKGNLTLYISYISTGVADDGEAKRFIDGELLTADVDIITGPLNSAFIPSGESFASAITTNATSTGSAFSISNGVYFIRGNFVNVYDETYILSQYTNEADCRVGLKVNEEIINSDEDETLTDNSKGFNNYAAPGADRLKISCSLFSKPLDDYNDANFVELATIRGGILQSQTKNTQYNLIADELARRTYSESGDYTTKPFDITLKESLNDGTGNNGVFEEGQFTPAGTLASEDLAVYAVSPGKAFVKGYEVETISTTYLDCPKPRTTKTIEGRSIEYNTGSTLQINRVYGTPQIGIGNTYIVALLPQRVGADGKGASSVGIGLARVYDCVLETGSYSTSNSNQNRWDIALYDIQFDVALTLNEPTTLTIPSKIEGKYSGATGYLKNAVSNSASLIVYDTQGEFVPNEPFIFNGVENTRVAAAVTAYGMNDVKSIYGGPDNGNVGFARTFNADVVQTEQITIGDASFTIIDAATGICTVTSSSQQFPGKIKINNILRFGGLGNDVPSFARVVTVGSDNITVTGVTTVTGVVSGHIPSKSDVGVTTTGHFNVSDLTVMMTHLTNSGEPKLYTQMPRHMISDVDLTVSNIDIRKSYDVVINHTENQLNVAVNAGADETFLPFDEERYTLVRWDGTTEVLTADRFGFSAGNTVLQIYNIGTDLSANQEATLITTLRKTKPTAKIKRKKRVNSVVINKSKDVASGTGATTLNDGLVYGLYPYGTRVQDEQIALNTPDIIKVHGVFESNDTSEASAPKMTLASLTGPTGKTTDLIIGETFKGKSSGAIAVFSERVTDSQLSYILQNTLGFTEGEVVNFKESKVQAIVTTLEQPSRNVTSDYIFGSGQKSHFYDYGYLRRREEADPATKSLKIYFSDAYYDSSDDGDLTIKNSYNSFDFIDEIRTVNGIRNTDIIDIRPRVSSYTVAESTRSPFEFYGRTFNGSGNSASNILASDESIIVNFSFYLGRIDRIFLTKDGRFQVQYGEPAENPTEPVIVDDALQIGSSVLDAYTLDPKTSSEITFLEHKRYRMSDIKKLEDRIQNLEYYTSLSLLEADTKSMFIPDDVGLNRFKSGFFVDNFTGFECQEGGVEIQNSIDILNQELRPKHYTNALDLQMGPVEGVTSTDDLGFTTPEGTNIKRSGDIVTLDYEEVEWLKQSFATRAESITPFLVSFWQMSMELTPASDTWVDTARVEAKIIRTEGNYAQTMQDNPAVDPQTGMSPILWNSWQTVWTGQEVTTRTRRTNGRTRIERGTRIPGGSEWHAHGHMPTIDKQGPGGRRRVRYWHGRRITEVVEETVRETIDTGTKTRQGQRTVITEKWDNTSQGDKVINREVIPIMRSRNVQFVAKKCKPLTRMYPFFDGQSVIKYCVPKLLEIEMTVGTFRVGETVTGSMPTNSSNSIVDKPEITFRVAQQNHKEGPYNAPTSVFTNNPYTSQTAASSIESFLGTPGVVQLGGSATANIIPATYSSNSTILNVDTYALSNQAQGEFWGYVETGMVLKGQYGAEAKITDLRLISDLGATLIGSYFIPNPNILSNPKFETGTKTFTLIDNTDNDQDNAESIGEETYTASGTLETVQEQIISVRNARVEVKQETQSERVERGRGNFQVINRNVIRTRNEAVRIREWYDPLAQSYQVLDDTGVFVTSCDVFFKSKDDMDIPMTFQIRTMNQGTPTQKILPFSETIVYPKDISVSSKGDVPTRVTFKAPVYLEPGMDYALTLASWSTKYHVFISRVGESDLLTDEFISQQPYLGSLFKSQNASTWEPSQWEDLKFTLYRADFETSGTLEIYNPVLSEGNAQKPILQPNSINLLSRKVRVGLGTTVNGGTIGLDIPELGNTIYQEGTNATGNYVASAGFATGDLGILRAGIGYTPASGSYQFVGVGLSVVTGNGKDAYADIYVTNGVAVAATITKAGPGFQVGDVLGITTTVGVNARLSVVSIGNTNELTLDNVQGDFETGVGKTMMFTNSVGVGTTMNGMGGNVLPTNIEVVSDGLHFTVNHKNHGMYHETNRVILSNAETDVPLAKLTSPYSNDSTAALSIDSSSHFSLFENVSVATTNPGYAKLGNEIISYTGVSGNTLTGVTRGIESTNAQAHLNGASVEKYELGGISLRRINTTHYLNDTTLTANPITYDSYTLKLDTTANVGVSRTTTNKGSYPVLYANATKSTGGYKIRATQNMPFEVISPMVHNITVPGTSVSAEMRTVSGTSLNNGKGQGSDIPFADKGWESVTLNKNNYMDTPRLIASGVNENYLVGDFSGNRSFNMRLNLESNDSRISPIIDTQRLNVILTSNRVDQPITDYKTDKRVNGLETDPTACRYVSAENVLTSGASSLQVTLAAHINVYCDIRAFYAIADNSGEDPIFRPFPGYKNLDNNGEIIAVADNSGLPDNHHEKMDVGDYAFSGDVDWADYKFSIDDLPTFKSYRVKIVLTSTDQTFVPRMKDLRCIALA